MKKTTTFIHQFALLVLLLSACSPAVQVSDTIFRYKDSYVGDNGAVGNIIRHLPGHQYANGIALETKKEPYGIIVKYRNAEADMKEDERKEMVLYNATFMFALIKNVDWITFDFAGTSHTVTRAQLQKWYGKELRTYTNEEELIQLIQAHKENKEKGLPSHGSPFSL